MSKSFNKPLRIPGRRTAITKNMIEESQMNTKSAMEKMIIDEGYEVVEMNQFKPGASYAIFRKPGKQNPIVYKVSEITLD